MFTRLGRYAIEGEIGRGGMGIVYRARDERLGKVVAVKVLLNPSSLTVENRKRFRQEARSAAILNHPSIVAVYDYDEDLGNPFVVCEYVEGQTLDKTIAAGPLSEDRIADIGGQVAAGLAYAHERGILHRDIKPQNIIVSTEGRTKILDFGLAKKMRPDMVGPDDETLDQELVSTVAGTILGTVQYMSPEQVGGETLDGRTDVFSLGAVLYEMATGRNPFLGKSLTSTVGRIMSSDPPQLDADSYGISNELKEVILRALQKKREDRYQSAALLREDLERIGNLHLKRPASPAVRASAAGPAEVKPAAADVAPIIPRPLGRTLLILLQVLYLGIYGAALYYHQDVISRTILAAMPHLGASFVRSFEMARLLAVSLLVSGCCGIPLRLFIMASAGFDDPETGRQFRRLFPLLVVLDEIWALTPLLLVHKWPPGLAVICVVLLAYLPASQRNLVRSVYR